MFLGLDADTIAVGVAVIFVCLILATILGAAIMFGANVVDDAYDAWRARRARRALHRRRPKRRYRDPDTFRPELAEPFPPGTPHPHPAAPDWPQANVWAVDPFEPTIPQALRRLTLMSDDLQFPTLHPAETLVVDRDPLDPERAAQIVLWHSFGPGHGNQHALASARVTWDTLALIHEHLGQMLAAQAERFRVIGRAAPVAPVADDGTVTAGATINLGPTMAELASGEYAKVAPPTLRSIAGGRPGIEPDRPVAVADEIGALPYVRGTAPRCRNHDDTTICPECPPASDPAGRVLDRLRIAGPTLGSGSRGELPAGTLPPAAGGTI